jgi:hypothetical protein
MVKSEDQHSRATVTFINVVKRVGVSVYTFIKIISRYLAAFWPAASILYFSPRSYWPHF